MKSGFGGGAFRAKTLHSFHNCSFHWVLHFYNGSTGVSQFYNGKFHWGSPFLQGLVHRGFAFLQGLFPLGLCSFTRVHYSPSGVSRFMRLSSIVALLFLLRASSTGPELIRLKQDSFYCEEDSSGT